MSRPRNIRKVACTPDANYFKPKGIPMKDLEEVILTIDEFESVRLTDFEKLYQEKAAEQMGVSRQTIGRSVETARYKILDAILNNKALRIEGGSFTLNKSNRHKCRKCKCNFTLNEKIIQNRNCPKCEKNLNIKEN